MIEGIVVADGNVDIRLRSHLSAPFDELIGTKSVVFITAPDKLFLWSPFAADSLFPVIVVDGGPCWPPHDRNLQVLQHFGDGIVFCSVLVDNAAIDNTIVAVFQH